ncbi:MAG TPA: bacteriohemerythrin [Bryobacteraceae bacterium]|jgi:hemerythrin-like metal-binding protein
MFEWKPEYSVSIPSIDAQHQGLFRTAGELHAAMTAGQGKAAMAKVLDRLVQYTAAHFAHEERLMAQHNYPDLAAHHAEHEALTKQVLDFQEKFQTGQALVTVQLLQFLKSWLEKHIQGTDARYSPYLMNKVA